MPLASKMVKITDAAMETTATIAQGSPVDVHQAALFNLGFLTFLGLLGASSSASPAYVGGASGSQHEDFVAVGDVGVGDPVATGEGVDRQAGPSQ